MKKLHKRALAVALAACIIPSTAYSQTLKTTLPIADAQPLLLSPQMVAMRNRIDQLEQNTNADRQRREQIAKWYEKRNFEPIWLSGSKPSKQAQEVIYTMMTAYECPSSGFLGTDGRLIS